MEESGCYMQLLLKMWQANGSLPLDMSILGSICRMSKTKFIKVWYKIEHYFSMENGRIYSDKLTKELEKNKDISQKNSENVKKKHGKILENYKENYNNLSTNPLINNVLVPTVVKPIEESRIEDKNKLTIVSLKNEKENVFSENENLENNQSLQGDEKPIAEKRYFGKHDEKVSNNANGMSFIPLSNEKRYEIDEEPEISRELGVYFKNQAKKQGFDDCRAKKELQKFLSHHLANKTRFANWQAACRIWLLKASDYEPKVRGSPALKVFNAGEELEKLRSKRMKDVTGTNQTITIEGGRDVFKRA
jgi:uncharacterized protein YdaU (DUF1376 family)